MFKSVELRQNSRIIDKYVGMNVIILKVLCKIYPILLNRYVEKLIAEFFGIGTELLNYLFHFFFTASDTDNGATMINDKGFGNSLAHTA